MEFFNWLSVPQYVLQYAFGGISISQIYICLGVAGALYFICLMLGGLGLYTMGTRAGVKHAWLAFLPFANTYYTGKIAGDTRFFGAKMKRAGLYAMIVEIVYVGLEVLSLVISFTLSNPAFYETQVVGDQYRRTLANVPPQYAWMVSGMTWVPLLSTFVFLALAVFLCAVYNALYRKYYARSPFLMTILSVLLPVRGFILFAVRKNKPVDYEELMRKRMEQVMRQSGMPGYGTPTANSGEDPFTEYKERKGESSPFSEFDGGGASEPHEEPDDAPNNKDKGE